MNHSSIILPPRKAEYNPKKNTFDDKMFRVLPVLWVVAILIIITGFVIIFKQTESAAPAELIVREIPTETTEDFFEQASPKPTTEPILSDEELIAQVVEAEARGEEMIGKVAVATTILNRADYYGLAVEAVVSAKNQYSYPYSGEISEDSYRAVEIALANRDLFPRTMMWFRTGQYHSFADDYLQIGNHYFSYLKEG